MISRSLAVLFEMENAEYSIVFSIFIPQVLSNPEFLAEGTAIKDLLAPDRVLIGGEQTDAGRQAIKALSSVYQRWIPSSRIISMNTWSSELSKLVSEKSFSYTYASLNIFVKLVW